MRRVLFIHYHFLPVHNVAVKQLLGYARHLPSFGWQPIVLSHDWKGIREQDASWGLSWEPELAAQQTFEVHRVAAGPSLPFRRSRLDDPWLLRKALSFTHMIAGSYPDVFAPWTRPAVRRGMELVRDRRIDAILTYCPPETNHVVGRGIARALGVPWVAAFGDLYGFFLAPLARRSVGAAISRACHRRWLEPASALAAVSPYMREYLSRTYEKPTSLILVGFEPGEFANARRPAGERRNRCVISHVGSLYPGNQRPEIFADGLDRFVHEYPGVEARLEVRFVGSKCDETLRALVRRRPSERVFRIETRVSSAGAVDLVRESDALLAFNCTAFRDRHGTLSYPSKIFEAMGARRPLLVMPADHDWVDLLLERTRAGVSASSAQDVARVLGRWFAEWDRMGTIAYEGDHLEIAGLSHERQAGLLAQLLEDCVAGHHDR